MDLKKVSSDDLRKELESRGFYTDNLWHIDDVPLTDPGDCIGVLDKVLSSDYVISMLNDIIQEESELLDL